MEDNSDTFFKALSPFESSSFKNESDYDEDEDEFLPNNEESDFYDDDHNYEDYEEDDYNGASDLFKTVEFKIDSKVETVTVNDINKIKKFPTKLLRTPKCAR